MERTAALKRVESQRLGAINTSWLWLIPFILLMFWLGARGLNADSIWFDEYWSIYDSGGEPFGPLSPVDVWNRVATRNPQQGPGFYLILNMWSNFVGSTPFAGRAMSLLAGVLAMAWVYRLGRDIVSARVGLYAAGVMATSAFYIYYLHELRVYTLVVLVTCVTVWSYWRIVTTKTPGWWAQAALLASVTLSLYLHYLTAITLAAIGLYHLLFVPKDWRWWRVVLLMGAAGVLFLPWVGNLLTGLGVKERDADDPNTALIPNLLLAFGNGSFILLAIFMGLALRLRGRGAGMVWFVSAVVVTLIFLFNFAFKFPRVRYMIAVWPLLALLVAMGMAWLAQTRFKPVLALGGWALVGLWMSFSPNFMLNFATNALYPFDVASAALRQHVQPGDVVAFNLPEGVKTSLRYEVAHYYMRGIDVQVTLFGVDSWYDQAMQFLQESPLRLWIAYEQPTSVMTAFEDAVPASYQQCPAVPAQSTIQLDLFARSEVCCVPDAPPLMRFGDGIALTGVEPIPDVVTDSLPVLVGWSVAESVQAHTYSVAFHVVDAEDNLVAQADYGLPELAFSCHDTQIALNDLPPGDYAVYVIVYAWESGQRLQGEQGERLLLGTFRVEPTNS